MSDRLNGHETGGKRLDTEHSERVCSTGRQQHGSRTKINFWQDLDRLIKSVSKQERKVLGANLNRHVGKGNIGD